MKIKQQHSGIFDAIGFNMHKYLPDISSDHPFNIAYVLEENYWNGKRSLQMRLKDIHFQENIEN